MTKTIAFPLYPGLTPLDLIGPLQVMSALAHLDPTYRTVVVGQDLAPVTTDTPALLAPSHTFDEITEVHTLIVPGGREPAFAALANEPLLAWIRKTAATAQVIGSVCTGSLLLGAAGLLEGRRAATHWLERDYLTKFGAIPVAERWVEDGPVITAAGVSAGIDAALHLVERLAGRQLARTIQLFIEYDPQPPQGPIDWNAPEVTALAAHLPDPATRLAPVLADHPELLHRLTT